MNCIIEKLLSSNNIEDVEIAIILLKDTNLPLEGEIKRILWEIVPGDIILKYFYSNTALVNMRDRDKGGHIKCDKWVITWK